MSKIGPFRQPAPDTSYVGLPMPKRWRPSTWHRHVVMVRDDAGMVHPCKCSLARQLWMLVVERWKEAPHAHP